MAWLFDLCPPDYRSHEVLRRYPVLLARFAAQVEAGAAHVASEALIAASSRTGRARELAQVFERACAGGAAVLAADTSASEP